MSGNLKIVMCGLGLMGTPIAERIATAGYPLTVRSRSAAKSGAVPHRAATLAHLASEAAKADVVVLCLANDRQSRTWSSVLRESRRNSNRASF